LDATKWNDNATFSTCGSPASLRIQDQYVVCNSRRKWAAVRRLYHEANSSSGEKLFINYTSGYKRFLFLIPRIPTVASIMNAKIKNFFKTHTSGHFGITAMDFVDAENCNDIIETNFQ
jgi:1-phosphatidylinositol phosphodiesterase